VLAAGIRLLSQLQVSYRGSPLSVDETAPPPGGPRAGDRLPDQTVTCAGRSTRLHELLARPGVHVLLDRDAGQPGSWPGGPLVHTHRLTSVPGHSLTAIRPDGYIGLRCQAADVNQLNAWLALIKAARAKPGPAAS
jgi:hypothetical protein